MLASCVYWDFPLMLYDIRNGCSHTVYHSYGFVHESINVFDVDLLYWIPHKKIKRFIQCNQNTIPAVLCCGENSFHNIDTCTGSQECGIAYVHPAYKDVEIFCRIPNIHVYRYCCESQHGYSFDVLFWIYFLTNFNKHFRTKKVKLISFIQILDVIPFVALATLKWSFRCMSASQMTL